MGGAFEKPWGVSALRSGPSCLTYLPTYLPGFQPIKPLHDRQDFGLKRRDTGHGAGRRDDERRDDRARRSWLVTRIPDTGAS